MKLFYLLPTLKYNGPAKQVVLLAQALASQNELHVCTFQEEGAWTSLVRAAGATVHSLDWHRAHNPMPLWNLRRLLQDLEPDVIHVWRQPALRTLALVGRAFLDRAIVSHA